MWKLPTTLGTALFLTTCAMPAVAQVYSPVVLREGAVDTTNLRSMAESIVRNAHAETPREKAEAIWRYFLTDGRFVKPGIFYHIPGWSYEEPMGEVLDPVKLVNSYGFGLCYQDAPLLQATWEALGMKARVWFLTGHTVAEVFYDGGFHYYDSDMMGYTTVGDGPVWSSPVASVQQLEADPNIILHKLISSRMTRAGSVDAPWYPADLRAEAIPGIAELFASRNDNYLYSGNRYPNGHTMDFVLRPGEEMIRYYAPPDPAHPYLPYYAAGGGWEEFPKDTGEILLVKNGPRSEKDERRWSTGVLRYQPDSAAQAKVQTTGTSRQEWIYRITSPYVLIDAVFQANVPRGTLQADTSTDDGHTWTPATVRAGEGSDWAAEAAELATSKHGTHSAVAGTYQYLLRLRAGEQTKYESLPGFRVESTFEFNPRTLPEILPGNNRYTVSESPVVRREVPVHARDAVNFATASAHVVYQNDGGQGYLRNVDGFDGELVFAFAHNEQGALQQVDAGGRFLDLSSGLAPDKLTAETRHVTAWPAEKTAPKTATVAWSNSPHGPWHVLWSFQDQPASDGGSSDVQMLRWPEVDRQIKPIAAGTESIYVQYRFRNMAVDDIRLATMRRPREPEGDLQVTQCWSENGRMRQVSKIVSTRRTDYEIDVPADVKIVPYSLVLAGVERGRPTQAACGQASPTPLQAAK